ncbi:MAG: sarcosine oxidase subunit gamma, partial [Alphaproteobacteria bacterium]
AALPLEPLGLTGAGDRVAWLAPDRWLVVAHDRAGEALADALRKRLGRAAHVHDVTDGLVAVDVTGRRGDDVMAAVCGLDLHARAFPADRAARTLVGGVDVLIYRVDGGFRLHVGRPVARHLWAWLVAAARDTNDGAAASIPPGAST